MNLLEFEYWIAVGCVWLAGIGILALAGYGAWRLWKDVRVTPAQPAPAVLSGNYCMPDLTSYVSNLKISNVAFEAFPPALRVSPCPYMRRRRGCSAFSNGGRRELSKPVEPIHLHLL